MAKQVPQLIIIELEIYYILQNSINSCILYACIIVFMQLFPCDERFIVSSIFYIFSSQQPERLFWSAELIKLLPCLNSLNGAPLLSEGNSYFLVWLLQALHDLARVEDKVLRQSKSGKSNRGAPWKIETARAKP